MFTVLKATLELVHLLEARHQNEPEPEDNESMSYMHSGEDAEPTDPFDESHLELTDTDLVSQKTHDRTRELIVENVEKLHRTAKGGPIENDESVKKAMGTPFDSFSPGAMYYYNVGPVAANLDTLEWNSAYRVDLSETVEPKGEEFKEITSEFNIPDSSLRELVPSFIVASYIYLIDVTERNDGDRAVHPWELKGKAGPVLTERNYEYALKYIDRLPGVIPPDTKAPAWEYVDSTEPTESTEESHA